MPNKTSDIIINVLRAIFSFRICKCKSKCCDMDVEIDNRSKTSNDINNENDIIPEDKHQKTSII